MAIHRFQKGNKLGPGRPKNKHDKLTYLLRVTSPEEREGFVRKCFDDAMKGDPYCMRFVWDCLPTKPYESEVDQSIIIDVQTEEQVNQAMQDTLTLVGENELSIDEGLKMATLIEKRGIVLMKQELTMLNEEEERAKNE